MSGIESNIWKLYVIKALRWFLLIIPVIVLFWQENGLSMQEIMLLQSLFSIGVIVFEIPSGYFSDVMGRKQTLVLGCILCFLGFFIYALSFGFWGFLAAELTMGLGVSLMSGTDSAILYDTLVQVDKKDRYKVMEGRMLSAGNFSEGIASFIGGYLALISLRTPLVIETVLIFFMIPLSMTLVEPERKKHPNTEGPFKEILKIVHFALHGNRKIKWLIAYAAITGASTLVMVWLTQPYFKHTGLPLPWFGIVWGVLNLSVGVFSLNAHRFEGLVGKRNTLVFLACFSFTGYMLLSFFDQLFALVFIFIFYFVRGIAGPLIKDYINQQITSDMRVTVLSVKSMASRLAFSVTSPFVGWVTDAYTLSAALFVSGVMFLFGLMFCLVFLRKHGVI